MRDDHAFWRRNLPAKYKYHVLALESRRHAIVNLLSEWAAGAAACNYLEAHNPNFFRGILIWNLFYLTSILYKKVKSYFTNFWLSRFKNKVLNEFQGENFPLLRVESSRECTQRGDRLSIQPSIWLLLKGYFERGHPQFHIVVRPHATCEINHRSKQPLSALQCIPLMKSMDVRSFWMQGQFLLLRNGHSK